MAGILGMDCGFLYIVPGTRHGISSLAGRGGITEFERVAHSWGTRFFLQRLSNACAQVVHSL